MLTVSDRFISDKMRFRGRISDGRVVRRFDTILTAVSKMSKECVLRVTPEKMYLISTEPSSVLGGPVAWGEIDKDRIFSEYNMEGVSLEHNEIYLEFSPDTLHKNLPTLKSPNVQGLKIKLTKRNGIPNLTFEVQLGNVGAVRQVVHDVPVQVIPRKYWSDYQMPTIPPVQISLIIHEIKRFRTIIEKYKVIGSLLTVVGYRGGKMNLSIETDDVKVCGNLTNLKSPILKPGSEPWVLEEEESASVRVDIKRLNQFMASEMILPEKVIFNLVDGEMIHILMVAPEISYQIFIPKSNK